MSHAKGSDLTVNETVRMFSMNEFCFVKKLDLFDRSVVGISVKKN